VSTESTLRDIWQECDRCDLPKESTALRQTTRGPAKLCYQCLEQICGLRCTFCNRTDGNISVWEEESPGPYSGASVLSAHPECFRDGMSP